METKAITSQGVIGVKLVHDGECVTLRDGRTGRVIRIDRTEPGQNPVCVLIDGTTDDTVWETDDDLTSAAAKLGNGAELTT
jgi:hypothetical protein